MNNALLKIACFSLLIFAVPYLIAVKNHMAPIQVAFRIDDLGIDDFAVYQKIIPVFQKRQIPLTIGIVPFTNNEENVQTTITAEMREYLLPLIKKGEIEIALHGYSHDNMINSKTVYSEFYKVDSLEQYTRILRGKNELEQIFGTHIYTFIPPWNTYDDITTNILFTLGFSNISGARYGAIGYGESKLKYIPYTANLFNLNSTVNKITKSQAKNDESTIVVLFHAYDFEMSNKFPRGHKNSKHLTIYELENLLDLLKLYNNLDCLTINELGKKNINFSSKRLAQNRIGKNILPLPSFLKPQLAFFYKDYDQCTLFYYQYIVPLISYAIFIVIGIFVGRALNSLLCLKKYLYGICFVLVLSILIMLLLILLGKLGALGFMVNIIMVASLCTIFIRVKVCR